MKVIEGVIILYLNIEIDKNFKVLDTIKKKNELIEEFGENNFYNLLIEDCRYFDKIEFLKLNKYCELIENKINEKYPDLFKFNNLYDNDKIIYDTYNKIYKYVDYYRKDFEEFVLLYNFFHDVLHIHTTKELEEFSF